MDKSVDLEKSRKKKLVTYFGLLILLILIIVALIAFVVFIAINVISSHLGSLLAIFSLFLVFITMYCMNSVIKNYEVTVKKEMLPNILKRITGNNGFIKWQKQYDTPETPLSTIKFLVNLPREIKEIEEEFEEFNKEIEKDMQQLDEKSPLDINIYGNREDINEFNSDFYYLEYCAFQSVEKMYGESGVFQFEDDVFGGIYKNVDFIVQEANIEPYKGKSKYFSGTMIRIKSNKKYENPIAILKNSVSNIKDKKLKSAKIDLKNDLIPKQYKLFSKDLNALLEILNPQFIELIKKPKQNISFLFEEDNIFILIESKKDKYKLGSLFKNVNDRTQCLKFEDDVRAILNIVVQISDMPQFDCKIKDIFVG